MCVCVCVCVLCMSVCVCICVWLHKKNMRLHKKKTINILFYNLFLVVVLNFNALLIILNSKKSRSKSTSGNYVLSDGVIDQLLCKRSSVYAFAYVRVCVCVCVSECLYTRINVLFILLFRRSGTSGGVIVSKFG